MTQPATTDTFVLLDGPDPVATLYPATAGPQGADCETLQGPHANPAGTAGWATEDGFFICPVCLNHDLATPGFAWQPTQ